MPKETPFLVVVLLTVGEFGYATFLLFHHGDIFALYLAFKYSLAEKWSPMHYLEEHLKRKCWKHIPIGQCIPETRA